MCANTGHVRAICNYKQQELAPYMNVESKELRMILPVLRNFNLEFFFCSEIV